MPANTNYKFRIPNGGVGKTVTVTISDYLTGETYPINLDIPLFHNDAQTIPTVAGDYCILPGSIIHGNTDGSEVEIEIVSGGDETSPGAKHTATEVEAQVAGGRKKSSKRRSSKRRSFKRKSSKRRSSKRRSSKDHLKEKSR